MPLILPLRDDVPHFGFTTELDGVTFGLEFRWNGRDSAWYFNLTDADGAMLLAGLRVVVRHLYLGRFRYLGLPAGELEFIDTTDADEEAGLGDLGSRVLLVYTPSGELPEGYAA
jgi:hypothetical protein